MNPKNEAVEAYMKEHCVSRRTAYSRLNCANENPSTVQNSTVQAELVSTVQPPTNHYDKTIEKHYGKVLPSTETYTLMDGTVIPIYRREFPNGNNPIAG